MPSTPYGIAMNAVSEGAMRVSMFTNTPQYEGVMCAIMARLVGAFPSLVVIHMRDGAGRDVGFVREGPI